MPRDNPEKLSFRLPCPLSQFQGHIDEHQDILFKVSYIMPWERSGANLGTFQGKFKLQTLRYAGRRRCVGVWTAHQSGFLEESVPVRNIGSLIIFLGEVWEWKSEIDVKRRKNRQMKKRNVVLTFLKIAFLFCGATAHIVSRPPHCWGFWLTHTRAVELLWTIDRLVAQAAMYTTNIHMQRTGKIIYALRKIRTRDPSSEEPS